MTDTATPAAVATPAPAAAPAPTPVVVAPEPAPAPAPVATPEAPAPKEDTGPAAHAWETTGDASLDLALNYIGQRGFGPEHPSVVAAMRGDFGLLKAELAGLGSKAVGYEAYIALAEKAYKDFQGKEAETQAAIQTAAVAAAGDEDTLVAVLDWAREQADEQEKKDINAMLAAGPRQAKAAITYLRTLYENAGGTTKQPASAVTGEAGVVQTNANAPIATAREFADAVSALHKKLGSRMEASPEYAALRARRLAGKR